MPITKIPKKLTSRFQLLRGLDPTSRLVGLVVLVVEAIVLGMTPTLPEDKRHFAFIMAGAVLVVALMVVPILAFFRRDVRHGRPYSPEDLADSLGRDIYMAVEGYIDNAESEDDRKEAYQTLTDSIEATANPEHQQVRKAIAGVVREQVRMRKKIRLD